MPDIGYWLMYGAVAVAVGVVWLRGLRSSRRAATFLDAANGASAVWRRRGFLADRVARVLAFPLVLATSLAFMLSGVSLARQFFIAAALVVAACGIASGVFNGIADRRERDVE